MQIEYSKTAVKFINKMDRPTKQRIKAAIEGLTEQPPRGDIKILQGYTDGRKRLRVGKYRIIYNYLPNGEIEILLILIQEGIYTNRTPRKESKKHEYNNKTGNRPNGVIAGKRSEFCIRIY